MKAQAMFARTFSFCRRMIGLPAAGQAAASTDDDRRVWLRHPANLVTTYQVADGPAQTKLRARVQDISRGGINLLVDRRFDTGELLNVELPQQNGAALDVLACVVRVEEQGGDWSLGCVFSRQLSDEDLRGYGAKREKTHDADQRGWKRFPVELAATYRHVGCESEPPLQSAQVLNISASGIGLLVSEEFENGSLLDIELSPLSGKKGRRILACIVHVSRRGGGEWALGCNFIRELSESDLASLV